MVLHILMPWRVLAFRKKQATADGLTSLRTIWLALVLSLFLFLLTLSFVVNDRRVHRPMKWWLVGVALAGCSSLLLTAEIKRRPLRSESPEALAKSYLSHFFIGFAQSEIAALLGFVAVFITGRLWPYLEGLSFTLAGMILVAPTAGNLDRYQSKLRAQGSSLSLVEALKEGLPRDKKPPST